MYAPSFCNGFSGIKGLLLYFERHIRWMLEMTNFIVGLSIGYASDRRLEIY